MNYAIIAAGEGSRLAQEGVERPKPLVELNGTPMIKRLIDIMLDCNAESLSIIVNEQMTEVRRYIESLTLPVPLYLTVKSTPSSMHSFRQYVNAFEHDDSADGYMAVTSFIDDEKPLYIDVDNDMFITAFRDNPWDGVKYISGGIYGLTAPALDILDDCMKRGVSRMRNYQRALVEGGLRLKAYPFSKIVDVDHAGDIATAERFIAEGNA